MANEEKALKGTVVADAVSKDGMVYKPISEMDEAEVRKQFVVLPGTLAARNSRKTRAVLLHLFG